MVGPKERLSEEAYQKWYARHKVVEKHRQWVKKLEANPTQPAHLLTETGIGYRFMP